MKIGPLEINLKRVGVYIAIAVVLIMVMNFNGRMEELTRLQDQAATVRVEGTAVMVTQHALETQLAQATSPAAAEEYARNQARMAQPGDNVVIPLPQPGVTPPPEPTPTPDFVNMTYWEIWMLYLFGK